MSKQNSNKLPQFRLPLDPANYPIDRCKTTRDDSEMRILIMLSGAFGDILMATPVLAALRKKYPTAHITWIAEYSERQAIDANPFIDDILIWDGAFWSRFKKPHRVLMRIYQEHKFAQMLNERKYDVFISLRPEEWPFLVKASGAKKSIGVFDTFRRFHGGSVNKDNQKYYTDVVSFPSLPDHRIEQYLLSIRAFDIPDNSSRQMTMGFTAEDKATADATLYNHGVMTNDQFIVLAPMTTWSTKCWSQSNFVELGKRLTRRFGLKLVVIGSKSEIDAANKIAQEIGAECLSIAGTMGFRAMAAVVERAKMLISGDTGPMHVASALGVPQVSVWGATSPDWYGPISPNSQTLSVIVPCGPCHKQVCANTGDEYEQCLKLITVDEVARRCSELLEPALV